MLKIVTEVSVVLYLSLIYSLITYLYRRPYLLALLLFKTVRGDKGSGLIRNFTEYAAPRYRTRTVGYTGFCIGKEFKFYECSKRIIVFGMPEVSRKTVFVIFRNKVLVAIKLKELDSFTETIHIDFTTHFRRKFTLFIGGYVCLSIIHSGYIQLILKNLLSYLTMSS